jgi:hypothetical protein
LTEPETSRLRATTQRITALVPVAQADEQVLHIA